jgi:CheY-like chemotaxis protein/anti-sigma regulatory factor (Ser/Thr protein kinase)
MDRRKDEFLAVLSHELRTPLNTMLGWVRMLRTGQLEGARTSHALEVIERSTRTQARLIDDLLDVSRIITGKFVLEARPVSLIAVIEAALEAVTTTAEAKTITIINMLDPSSASVWGDPVRLQQVVVNLVSNAIKFTPAGGRVEVRLDRDGSAARLTVVDTGQGIHPDFLPHIFDPFRQADGSSTRAHGGLGLGLAIVRNLVELHKGSVEAESAGGGKGATFRVRLPLLAVRLQHETSADHAARSIEWAAVRLEGTRVLVVDDDADTRSLLAWTLERVGAQVEAVATASDALAAIERARPDVLLSDIALPGWNGHDLIRHLRAMSDSWAKTLPAIALSAFASEDDAARTRAAGFQIHVRKPMDPGALVQIIASLVKDRTA